MATQTMQQTPTASQEASAAMHLGRQSEWRFYRVDGTRYVVLQSGNSGRVYHVRADARGCSCVFYERSGRTCSHMLAVERAALLDELREASPLAPHTVYDSIWSKCRTCNDVAERGDICDRCAGDAAYRARLASKVAAGSR